MRHTGLSDETSSPVLALDDAAGLDRGVVGAKAAALATARQAGMPVLDGFVLPTYAIDSWPADRAEPPDWWERDLRRAWQVLSRWDEAAVVVRSSSPNEDGEASSRAGQFRSVLDVRGWDALLDAIEEVIASAGSEPMAVLIQSFLQPAWGGVLFGAHPVTGRRDRLVVAAVPGGPDALVSGSESGTQLVMTPHGRVVESSASAGERVLSRPARRALAGLARQTADLFGAPQDVEWAVRQDGSLVLLQSRPITAVGHEAEVTGRGPVFGPGPVAETFPDALAPLEEDLWVPPLREGLRRALDILGLAPGRKLRSSPVVVTVGGRPAVDLELTGALPLRRPWVARLDPRPPARRLLAAWRLGRLRAALPALAGDIVGEVDAELRSLPPLQTLPVRDVLRLLERSAGVLTSLHGYEVLAGQLLEADSAGATAASRALTVLATERAARPDISDDQLIAEQPVLLSLLPPVIRFHHPLPPSPAMADLAVAGSATPGGPTPWREMLRLRIRWVQELTGRAALVLGDELVRRGVLTRPEDVRYLDLTGLRQALAGEPVDIEPAASQPPATTPLPRAFRRSDDGVAVPVAKAGDERTGRGAGGGRGMGRVHVDDRTAAPGAVLVVATLDPSLASRLPGLAGLVSETGSVLSHLAILAREHGVPTVVDLPDARQRFAEGTWVMVDGASGEVNAVESQEWRAA